jgi:elongation factor P
MFTINDLKVGTKITVNNQPMEVIFSQHSKLGRGGGIQRTKLRNLLNGTIIEKAFLGQEKIQEAELETKKMQFLYKDSDNYYFMDPTNFEQFALTYEQLGELSDFLKEGEEIDIVYFEGKPINVNLPIKIVLTVDYTEPGFKGNSATNVYKPAKLETGARVMVPLFIKPNDKIVIDTRTGEYVERA